MRRAIEWVFEDSIEFSQENGTSLGPRVYIGETELFAVELLREDVDAYRAEFNSWLYNSWLPQQRERREAMLERTGCSERYDDLLAAYHRGYLVPFVGSGMSASSGLPIWSGLLRQIRERTPVTEEALEPLLERYEFERAAQLLASSTNARLLSEQIGHRLRVSSIEDVAGPVRLLPELFGELVLTTNLDRILEMLYGAYHDPSFERVFYGLDIAKYRTLRARHSSYLLKLHGDCEDPAGRVLLPDEYDLAYDVTSPVRRELSLIFKDYSLLFLGCSLGPDRTIGVIEEVVDQDPSVPKHWAFLKAPGDRDKQMDREQWLTSRGIFPIWYPDDHDSALTCLLAGLLDARLAGAGSSPQ